MMRHTVHKCGEGGGGGRCGGATVPNNKINENKMKTALIERE